jgi:hypothetical protein
MSTLTATLPSRRKPTKNKSINVYYGEDELDEFQEIAKEAARFGLSLGNYLQRLARISRPLVKKNNTLLFNPNNAK